MCTKFIHLCIHLLASPLFSPPPSFVSPPVDIGVKSAAPVAAVSVDFPKNSCNFLHKNKLHIVRRVQFLTGRRPMRSFSPGAVATIAVWKSAPMPSHENIPCRMRRPQPQSRSLTGRKNWRFRDMRAERQTRADHSGGGRRTTTI